MSFKVVQNIPCPEEMLEKVSMSPKLQEIKKQAARELREQMKERTLKRR